MDKLKFNHNPQLLDFIAKHSINIYICAYKSYNLINISQIIKNDGENLLSLWQTKMEKPMSIKYDEKREQLFVGCKNELIQFSKDGISPTDNKDYKDFDVTFTQRVSNIINDINIHDININKDGKPYFCSSKFSCIGELDNSNSFKVYWKPPWISDLIPEDRCHLNGLCCVNGEPKYITSVSRSDIMGGWRHNRTKGVVYDIINDKLVCKNLSMPHSPVFYNGKLWILESGTGYFGYIDFNLTETDNGETYHPFIKQVFLPGFLRGIHFINNDFVIIGSSKERYDKAFTGLELTKTLVAKEAKATCGIYIINIKTMSIAHYFVFDDAFKNETETKSSDNSEITEIYDIICIHNCKRSVVKTIYEMSSDEYKIKN